MTNEVHDVSSFHFSIHSSSVHFLSTGKAAAAGDEGGTESDEEGEEEEDDEEGERVVEVRFAPDDTASLESMFKAMNECQLLHPDPEDVDSPDDEEEDDEEEQDEDEEGDDTGISVEYHVAAAEQVHGVYTLGNGNGE